MNLEFNYTCHYAKYKRCEFAVPVVDTDIAIWIGCHVWYERDEGTFVVRNIHAMDMWSFGDSKVCIPPTVFTGETAPARNREYVWDRLRNSDHLQACLVAVLEADWDTSDTEGTFQELKQEQQREGM